jgi:hypothetical protein
MLHTQDRHAAYPHEQGGDYVVIVKNNRPKLRTQLLPWREISVPRSPPGQRHGGVESRTVKLTAIGSGIIFRHGELAAQIVRRRRPNQRHDRYLAHRDR